MKQSISPPQSLSIAGPDRGWFPGARGTLAALLLATLAVVQLACGTAIVVSPPEPAEPVEAEDIVTTVFLIGDAGSPAPEEPVLRSLTNDLKNTPGERYLVFLGDNIYPAGLPALGNPARQEAERRLLAQVKVGLETGTRTWFVPGNHDWNYMGPLGWEAIRRQGEFIAAHGDTLVRLLPEGGCPGPEVRDVGNRLRLVMLDTQWWLHDFRKPADSTSGCATWTAEQVVDSLRTVVAGAEVKDSVEEVSDSVRKVRDSVPESNPIAVRAGIAADSMQQVADTIRNQAVVILAHHPMVSAGEHGGHFTWVDQIFPLRRFASWLWIPLPGVGSAEAVARRSGGTNQDISGPLYQRMLNAFGEAFDGHPPLVYAAGHDHNLQVLRGVRAKYVLVSGAGIFDHATEVGFDPATRYATELAGYMRLDELKDGRIRLGVITVDAAGEGKETFAVYLE